MSSPFEVPVTNDRGELEQYVGEWLPLHELDGFTDKILPLLAMGDAEEAASLISAEMAATLNDVVADIAEQRQEHTGGVPDERAVTQQMVEIYMYGLQRGRKEGWQVITAMRAKQLDNEGS